MKDKCIDEQGTTLADCITGMADAFFGLVGAWNDLAENYTQKS